MTWSPSTRTFPKPAPWSLSGCERRTTSWRSSLCNLKTNERIMMRHNREWQLSHLLGHNPRFLLLRPTTLTNWIGESLTWVDVSSTCWAKLAVKQTNTRVKNGQFPSLKISSTTSMRKSRLSVLPDSKATGPTTRQILASYRKRSQTKDYPTTAIDPLWPITWRILGISATTPLWIWRSLGVVMAAVIGAIAMMATNIMWLTRRLTMTWRVSF